MAFGNTAEIDTRALFEKSHRAPSLVEFNEPIIDEFLLCCDRRNIRGLPPQLDETGRIYLWGLKVYGERSSDYRAAVAHLGPGAEEDCWATFLEIAERLFGEYGDA